MTGENGKISVPGGRDLILKKKVLYLLAGIKIQVRWHCAGQADQSSRLKQDIWL